MTDPQHTLLTRIRDDGPLKGLFNWPRARRLVALGFVEAEPISEKWHVYRITDAGRRALDFYRKPPGGEGGSPSAGGRTHQEQALADLTYHREAKAA